jgi:hypothetical protein
MQPFTLSIGSNDDGVFLRAVGKRTQCYDEAPQRGCNATTETRFNVDVDSDLQDLYPDVLAPIAGAYSIGIMA